MARTLAIPDIIGLGPNPDPAIIDWSQVEYGPEKSDLDRIWRMILAMAIRDSAEAVHYHPWGPTYTLSYIVSGTHYGLVPLDPDATDRLISVAGELICGNRLGRLSRCWFGWPVRASGRVTLTGSFGKCDWAGVVWSVGSHSGVDWYRLDLPTVGAGYQDAGEAAPLGLESAAPR